MSEVDKLKDKIDEEKKITIPKELQTEMLKFFYKTSMPRIKNAKAENDVNSENKSTIKKLNG